MRNRFLTSWSFFSKQILRRMFGFSIAGHIYIYIIYIIICIFVLESMGLVTLLFLFSLLGHDLNFVPTDQWISIFQSISSVTV